MSANKYSKQDCIDSLRKAADELDKSPTRAEYGSLGLSPSRYVIQQRFDSWNKAKSVAGLSVTQNGSSVRSAPDGLNISKEEWENLSCDGRTRLRKRVWVAQKKIESGCQKCGYDEHPNALDYHHTDSNKVDSVSNLVRNNYSRKKISVEIEKCTLLCANCHRAEESKYL